MRVMDGRSRNKDELARRAKDLYERRIREEVEADGALQAGAGLRRRRPDASTSPREMGLTARKRCAIGPMRRPPPSGGASAPEHRRGLRAGASTICHIFGEPERKRGCFGTSG